MKMESPSAGNPNTLRKLMKWKVKKVDQDRWGIFLIQKYCKTDEPVCYGISLSENSAKRMCDRLNNPLHVEKL